MSEITPVTHTEKVVAGQVDAVTHFEKVIAKFGGGNVYESLEAGTNILIEETADGKAKISASGEISSEDTVARAEIAAIKDGTNIDSFGDVETALGDKQNTISDLSTIRSGAALGATAVQPETGKGLSTNDYTNAEKSKLAGIEAQANKTTVDDSLSDSSTNPVQNKVVKSALDSKANTNTTYTKTEVDTALGGKQNTIDSSHKLSADLVDDTSTTNKFATAAELEQIQTNKNNILSLNQVSPYNMAGTYNSETERASFAELYKLALDSLGLDTSVLHHYIVHVYTNTVSPTADLLIMYGTYYYNNSISHAVLYNSQLSYYADNKQGTLLVSGGDDTIHASVRFLD